MATVAVFQHHRSDTTKVFSTALLAKQYMYKHYGPHVEFIRDLEWESYYMAMPPELSVISIKTCVVLEDGHEES